LSAFVGIEATRRKLKKLRPASAQTLYALEVGAFGFFIAAIFGSMAHVSFLVLHVITIWSIAELMKREVAAAAAARRAQAFQLANAGTPLPAAR
ncbi:MAG TPA: hypothetical protein VKA54_06990, partial [Gemmatimonadaceae bacterium]|nr:hypothetical protein [Gemmatimonadaceae bacterium]